jgi:hypothetical protein
MKELPALLPTFWGVEMIATTKRNDNRIMLRLVKLGNGLCNAKNKVGNLKLTQVRWWSVHTGTVR